jgi:hypothetical protein
MQKFLHNLENDIYKDDIEKISNNFKESLYFYTLSELINALDAYLDTHEKLVEFSQIIIKLERNRSEKK